MVYISKGTQRECTQPPWSLEPSRHKRSSGGRGQDWAVGWGAT